MTTTYTETKHRLAEALASDVSPYFQVGYLTSRCVGLEDELARERERRIAAEAERDDYRTRLFLAETERDVSAGLRCDNHFPECSEADECLYPGRGWCRR